MAQGDKQAAGHGEGASGRGAGGVAGSCNPQTDEAGMLVHQQGFWLWACTARTAGGEYQPPVGRGGKGAGILVSGG